MKIRIDLKSIKFRLWISFLMLAIVILILVWSLQTVFLKTSYENMKIREVEQVAGLITTAFKVDDPDLTKNIQNLTYTSDLYVMMQQGDYLLSFTPDGDALAPVERYRAQLPNLREMLRSPALDHASYKFSSKFESFNTYAYAKTIKNAEGDTSVLYIFAPLYPLDSTVKILKDQLFKVSIIAIVFALILALIFTDRISRPLKKITYKAKLMGQGQYDVKFDGNSFSEINKLADTLNTAAVQLGQTDNLRKDLIANVSHDLKTPLTMVKSYAEMVRDLSGDNKEKREEHLNVIIEEADHMANLVSDMSALSKMQNATISIDKQPFDLVKSAASILSSYSILEESNDYKFTFTAPKEAIVNGDENRIKQVIANLTGNAVKYAGEKKEVIVSIKKINKKYRFEVEDHGIGISKEELPKIWDRYYRSSENFAREKEGTGLGLSIVKQILTLHSSDFGVESEVGIGSKFWFELDSIKK